MAEDTSELNKDVDNLRNLKFMLTFNWPDGKAYWIPSYLTITYGYDLLGNLKFQPEGKGVV